MTPEKQARLRALLTEALALLEPDALPTSPPAQSPQPSLPGLKPLAWGAKVSPTFRERVRWIADTLSFDPNWLMACMAFETGRKFSANVKNPQSTATGLIQFMAQTALDLGTTTKELAAMTAEDQLNYVYKYFAGVVKTRGPIRDLADCYMAIFLPSAVGKPPEHQLFIEGKQAYAVNAGLDVNKDSIITKAEAAGLVARQLADGMKPENLA